MKLKAVTGVALFFLVFIGSDTLLMIFGNFLGHDIISMSISTIFMYKLAISSLYALSAVAASIVVSPPFCSSFKTKTYFMALAAAVVFATGWLLFRLFILRSYLQDNPSDMPLPMSISIDIVNKIIVNENVFILSLLLLAFGYIHIRHRRIVT